MRTFIIFGILNFGIGIPISRFFNSGIRRKKIPTGIFGIENRIGIPLPMGVPEIGTKNWNSQPSNKAKLYYLQPKILTTKWKMDIDKRGYWKPHVFNSPALSIPKISKAVAARKKRT
jgi:hypothetical protein